VLEESCYKKVMHEHPTKVALWSPWWKCYYIIIFVITA